MKRTQYNPGIPVMILLGVALISCKTTEIKGDNTQAVTVSDSSTSLAPDSATMDSLPPESSIIDFDSFLVRFASSTELQRRSVSGTLKYSSLDMDAEPEPRMLDKFLPLNMVGFPVFPLDSTRQKRNLLYEVTKISQDSNVVTLRKPDTDYQVKYHFHREQHWVLDWVEDQSL